MLLNTSVAAGIRLFQKSFLQYFGTESEESGTLLHGRTSREVGGEGGWVGEGTTQKTNCKKNHKCL